MRLQSGPIVELGYVVTDLRQAIRFFELSLGAGPFKLFERLHLPNAKYLGCNTSPNIDVAMGPAGGIVIELIKQWDTAPSPFQLPTSGSQVALNHVSIFSDDIDTELQRHISCGLGVVFTADFPSAPHETAARIAYLDTRNQLGAYLEIMEKTPPVLLDLYQSILGGAG